MACIKDLHEDDIGTIIRVTVQDFNDDCVLEILDVSAATTKEFTFRKPGGTLITVPTAFTTDGTDGQIEYITVSGDLDEVGTWKIQVYLVLPAGSWRSDIGQFQVVANL